MTRDQMIERLAEKVHKSYCQHYKKRYGKEYWTKGDYSLLEDDVKEYDRVTVRAILDSIELDEELIYNIVKWYMPRKLKTERDIAHAIAQDKEVFKIKEER